MIDATCPLVTKVHVEAVNFARQGFSLVLIGHRDHDEIEGTLGEAPDVTHVVSTAEEVAALEVPDPDRVAYLTQTTLSLDEARDIIHALKAKFPNIAGPHSQDICYATENRQVAVKNVAHQADLVLVVGSNNSSNSNRLVEVSRNLSTNAFLIEMRERSSWLAGAAKTVAVTAGASAPEVLVGGGRRNICARRGFSDVEEVEVMPENVRFGLPPEIVQAIRPAAVHARKRLLQFVSAAVLPKRTRSSMSTSFEGAQPANSSFWPDRRRLGQGRRGGEAGAGLSSFPNSIRMAIGAGNSRRIRPSSPITSCCTRCSARATSAR